MTRAEFLKLLCGSALVSLFTAKIGKTTEISNEENKECHCEPITTEVIDEIISGGKK